MATGSAAPSCVAAHQRIHTSVLAGAEKRALVWIARRLPPAISSDHLSLLGLTSMMAAGVAFAAFPWTAWAPAAVVVLLAANWFGDSLDGTLARERCQERPRYGYYVDHIIDLAGTTCLLGGLAVSGLMTPLLALALLVAYTLVCAEAYLATHARGLFRMSFLGFGPTELRIVLAAGAMRAAESSWVTLPYAGRQLLFDVGGLVAVAGLAVAFVAAAIRNTQVLYAAEPLPQAQKGA